MSDKPDDNASMQLVLHLPGSKIHYEEHSYGDHSSTGTPHQIDVSAVVLQVGEQLWSCTHQRLAIGALGSSPEAAMEGFKVAIKQRVEQDMADGIEPLSTVADLPKAVRDEIDKAINESMPQG